MLTFSWGLRLVLNVKYKSYYLWTHFNNKLKSTQDKNNENTAMKTRQTIYHFKRSKWRLLFNTLIQTSSTQNATYWNQVSWKEDQQGRDSLKKCHHLNPGTWPQWFVLTSHFCTAYRTDFGSIQVISHFCKISLAKNSRFSPFSP